MDEAQDQIDAHSREVNGRATRHRQPNAIVGIHDLTRIARVGAGVERGAEGGTGRLRPDPNGDKMSKRRRVSASPLMLGYARVSTEEQAASGNGLEAQRAAIDTEASRRGWAVEHYSDKGVSGKIVGPQLVEVLQLLASGQADGLVIAKLDRLSRSIINAANMIDAAQKQGWSLVVLDMNLDLTTAAGRMMAGQLMLFAQYERELIGERTASALAAKKARGERVGRPRLATAGVVRRIVLDRTAGLSFGRIARALEAEAVLSPAGRPTWQPSTVRRIYQSATTATETVSA